MAPGAATIGVPTGEIAVGPCGEAPCGEARARAETRGEVVCIMTCDEARARNKRYVDGNG